MKIRSWRLWAVSACSLGFVMNAMGRAAEPVCAGTPRLVQEWIMPLSVIEEFLNPVRSQGRGILPFPSDPCWQVGKSLRILDVSKKAVGELVIQEVWRGRFTDRDLPKDASMTPKIFRDLLKDRGFPEFRTVDALLRLVYRDLSYERLFSLRLLNGRFNLSPDYVPVSGDEGVLNVDPLVKVVNYDELVPLLAKPSTAILDATASAAKLRGDEAWRVPRARALAPQNQEDPPRRFDLRELIRYWGTADRRMLPRDLREPVVVYGYPGEPAPALNILEWLRLCGYENPLWFRDGADGWNRRGARTDHLRAYRRIAAAKVAEFAASRQALILDLRPKREHAVGRIPGAESAELLTYTGAEFLRKSRQDPRFSLHLRGERQIVPGEVYSFVNRRFLPAEKSKTIIIYGHHGRDPALHKAAKNLKEVHGVEAQIYVEGFADWTARSQWLGAGRGYSLEGPSRSK